jgi:hypothetical protein
MVRREQHLTAGHVRVDGELVTDPYRLAPPPARGDAVRASPVTSAPVPVIISAAFVAICVCPYRPDDPRVVILNTYPTRSRPSDVTLSQVPEIRRKRRGRPGANGNGIISMREYLW